MMDCTKPLLLGYLSKHLLMTEPVTDIPRLG
jgi:hypothetical protein